MTGATQNDVQRASRPTPAASMHLGRIRAARMLREPTGRVTFACVAIVLVGIVLLPQHVSGDDAVRAVMLRQMADGIEPETKYSFIQPLVSVPPHWILDRLGFGIFSITLLPVMWISWWSWAVWRIVAGAKSTAFAHHAVVLSTVSMLLAYLVGFSSDVFTALGMSGGLIALRLGRTRTAQVTGVVVFIVAAANTPTMIAPTAVIALWLVLRERRLRFALLPIAVLAVTVIESSAVEGRLSWTRYSADVERGTMALLPWGEVSGFGWPLWSGLLAILFSFGRGLFFFVPHLWNGPSRGRDSVADVERLLWMATATLVPIYAMWWAWYGGVSFGPRFFMIAVVAGGFAASSVVSVPKRSTARTVVVLLATIASAWVAISGALFGVTTRAFEECVSGGTFEREALCLYTPEYSGIWAPIWAADPIGARDVAFVLAVVLALVPTVVTILAPSSHTFCNTWNRAARHLRGPWRP